MLLSTAVVLAGAGVVAAQGVVDANLYGTWSSKSNKTLTGPVRPLLWRYVDCVEDPQTLTLMRVELLQSRQRHHART